VFLSSTYCVHCVLPPCTPNLRPLPAPRNPIAMKVAFATLGAIASAMDQHVTEVPGVEDMRPDSESEESVALVVYKEGNYDDTIKKLVDELKSAGKVDERLDIYQKWENENKNALEKWRGHDTRLDELKKVYKDHPVGGTHIKEQLVAGAEFPSGAVASGEKKGKYDMRVVMGAILKGVFTWGDFLPSLRVAGSLAKRGLRTAAFLYRHPETDDPQKVAKVFNKAKEYINELLGIQGEKQGGEYWENRVTWTKDEEVIFDLVEPTVSKEVFKLQRAEYEVKREDLETKVKEQHPESEGQREKYEELGLVDKANPMVVLTAVNYVPYFFAGVQVLTVTLRPGDATYDGPQPEDMRVYLQSNDPGEENEDEISGECIGVPGDQRETTSVNTQKKIQRVQNEVDKMRDDAGIKYVVLVTLSMLGSKIESFQEYAKEKAEIGYIVLWARPKMYDTSIHQSPNFVDMEKLGYVRFDQLHDKIEGVDLIVHTSGMSSTWEAMRSGKLSVGIPGLSIFAWDKDDNCESMARVFSTGILPCWMRRKIGDGMYDMSEHPTMCPHIKEHPALAKWNQWMEWNESSQAEMLLHVLEAKELKDNAKEVGRQARVELKRTMTRIPAFFDMLQKVWRHAFEDSMSDFAESGKRWNKVNEVRTMGKEFLHHLRRVVVALDAGSKAGSAGAAAMGWVALHKWEVEAEQWIKKLNQGGETGSIVLNTFRRQLKKERNLGQ